MINVARLDFDMHPGWRIDFCLSLQLTFLGKGKAGGSGQIGRNLINVYHLTFA